MKVTADVMRMILHAPGEVDDGQPELSPKNAHIQPMEYGFAPVESGQAVSFVVDQQHWIAGFNTVALEVWHHSSLESLLTMALARDDVSLLPRGGCSWVGLREIRCGVWFLGTQKHILKHIIDV